jgi:hypothetical protein
MLDTMNCLRQLMQVMDTIFEDAPYDVVIVDYGQVQLTGQLAGADDDIAHGLDVTVQLGEATKTGEPVVTFVPAET